MQPTTDAFTRLMRQSHVIAATCQLIFPGTTDADAIAVPVEAGQVRIDRTAENRRAGNVEIPWSLRAGADLGVDVRTLPLGGYVLLRRGVRYASGDTELILLGRLRVESVSWGTLDASANLELADRMSQIRDEPFTAPYSAAGKTAATACVEIVQQVFGSDIAYNTPYAPTDVISDAFYSGQRSDALGTLSRSASAEAYFDANGDFVFARRPASDAPIVWTVDTGATGTMVDAHESQDRTGIYNGVLVTGQADGTSPPITALATFDDPTSPIRWGGPFGKVALLADSSSVQTVEQAAATAQDLLRLRLMQTRSLELTNAPNPALEAGDTVQVVFPDGRDERHLIDAVITDLG
ncbi:MAG TPA: DUF5047 domain-containing protein, partial [Solirubrobacteraceae bacterium]